MKKAKNTEVNETTLQKPMTTEVKNRELQPVPEMTPTETPEMTPTETPEMTLPEDAPNENKQPVTEQNESEQNESEQNETEQPETEQTENEQPDAEQPVTEKPFTEKPFTEQTETDQHDIKPTELLTQNISQWKKVLEGKEHGEEISKFISRLAEELLSGRLSDDTFDMLRRSVTYAQDMANARREGEIEGRNERIDEYLIERRKVSEIHDLSTTTPHNKAAIPQHIIGGLSAADRTSIWERGNEKRIKRE